jgi:hypothetical protein
MKATVILCILLQATVLSFAGISYGGDRDSITYYSDDIQIAMNADFLWRSVRAAGYSDGLIYMLMVNGLQIYDAGIDMTDPRPVSRVIIDQVPSDMRIDSDLGVLFDREGNLALLDLSESTQPVHAGAIDIEDSIFDYRSRSSVGSLKTQ